MRRVLPYLTGAAAILLLVVVLLASRVRPVRRMDERITLRQQDNIPYGMAVAKHLLPFVFPGAIIESDAGYPGAWDRLNSFSSNQAVILVADNFGAEKEELQRLHDFVAKGNHVFIIARSFSTETALFFNLTFHRYLAPFTAGTKDSLRVKLQTPIFAADTFFSYPGLRYESFVGQMDTAKTVVLGKNGQGQANFVQMRAGEGRFYIHTSPLAFSNYFLLHKQNMAYYQQAFSVMPQGLKRVLWNDYFLEKMRSSEKKEERNWLGALFNQTSFRWGFVTALATLSLYVLLGMRRRQRLIPPFTKPVNDSLDFVKTLGQLYYDRGDHKNLAQKMAAFFLEHVRSTYRLATHTLDEELVMALHRKSGYPLPETRQLVTTLAALPVMTNVSEEKLAYFHKQLELFYQNT